ncbi:hypothetical protein K435DRAFT_879942 [Dendrothele bispora CBS 962.96]|uniref:Uncharacterized protein n=1 Tax=Dendrothele bispora (strain CBS 962.96) TaxID=1314807 RepID=A0A4S8KKF5_DENBC|nr:hypothetical protein K435DRAFT_879942 [Dendrothele bispora CBS 962.96]
MCTGFAGILAQPVTTGTVSTPANIQASMMPTYAQIASCPPSPRPRSLSLICPTSPTGNMKTVQTVRHSIHAPPGVNAPIATPTFIADEGYLDDGFTLVEKKKKDKGKAKDNQVPFVNGSSIATPSTSAPFLHTPPRPAFQSSHDPRTELARPGTIAAMPTTADVISLAPPLSFTLVESPASTSNLPSGIPVPNASLQQVSLQTGPGTGVAIETNTTGTSNEELRKRKRARTEEPTTGDELLRTTTSPAWDESAPDITMDASGSNTPPLTLHPVETMPPVID